FAASDRDYVTVPSGGEAGPVNLLLPTQGKISGTVVLPPDLAARLPVDLDLVVEITPGKNENPYQRVQRNPIQVDSSFKWELTGCDPGRSRVRIEVPAAGGNRVGPWYALTLDPGVQAAGIKLELKETPAAVQGIVRDDRSIPLEGIK